MPELSTALDKFPELTAALGDLSQHAEDALLGLVAGSCLAGREAVRRQLAEMRQRLRAEAHNELERLLAGRVALDWLALQHAQLDLAAQLKSQSGTGPAVHAAQRRLDRAHARFLAATRTLATVQRLLRRAPSPLDLLRPAGDATVPISTGKRTGARLQTEMVLS
jgi:hypothetical protein